MITDFLTKASLDSTSAPAAGCLQSPTQVRFPSFTGARWIPADDETEGKASFEPLPWYPPQPLVGSPAAVRDVAEHAGEFAIAAENGLYLGDGVRWELALPIQGDVRWAPADVRAVTYDGSGQLWFASPQGVGCRVSDGQWRLFTGFEGLPYNDFTCIAAGPKGIWFGTTNGAVHYPHDGKWSFRQGGRWLLDNHVRDIVVDSDGNAWLATVGAYRALRTQQMTLAKKAAFYAEVIEKHHRRTCLAM